MSDIRFNQWLHQSGTGGVSQVASGAVGVGTTNPLADFYVRGDAQITGILTAGHIAMGSSITFGDDDRAYFGDGTDLQIYHSGSDSFIQDTGTGDLKIRSSNVRIEDTSGNLIINAAPTTAFLYSSGNAKLGTAGWGAQVNGIFKVLDATDSSGSTNKLSIGTGNDFNLYHDNNGDSYISNTTGHLTIRNNTSGKVINLQPKSGANGIIARYEGAAELYHNGNLKFATASTGVSVTGVAGIDNNPSTDVGLRVTNNSTSAFSTSENLEGTTNRKITPLMLRNGSTSANTETYLGFDAGHSSKAQWNIGVKKTGALQGDFIFNTRTGSSTSAERLRITSAGQIGIGTDAPAHALDIQGSSGSFTKLALSNQTMNTSKYEIIFGDQGQVNHVVAANREITFATNGSSNERLRITSGGLIGIGTATVRNSRAMQLTGESNSLFLITGHAPSICLNRDPDDSSDGDRSFFGVASVSNGFANGTAAGDTVIRGNSSGKIHLATSTSIRLSIASGGDTTFYGSNVSLTTGTLYIPDSLVHNGDNDTKIRFPSNDTITFETASNERLRIDSSGRVSINESTYYTQGQFTIKNTNDFSTASITTNTDNIFLISDATSGDGVYGASIGFSRVQYPDRRAAAIATVQEGTDEDFVGLSFFTHDDANATDPVVEKLRIHASGNTQIYGGDLLLGPDSVSQMEATIRAWGCSLWFTTIDSNYFHDSGGEYRQFYNKGSFRGDNYLTAYNCPIQTGVGPQNRNFWRGANANTRAEGSLDMSVGYRGAFFFIGQTSCASIPYNGSGRYLFDGNAGGRVSVSFDSFGNNMESGELSFHAGSSAGYDTNNCTIGGKLGSSNSDSTLRMYCIGVNMENYNAPNSKRAGNHLGISVINDDGTDYGSSRLSENLINNSTTGGTNTTTEFNWANRHSNDRGGTTTFRHSQIMYFDNVQLNSAQWDYLEHYFKVMYG